MGTEENQKAVFKFLLDHFRSQDPFTQKEMEDHTNWRGRTFDTYWSKQYRQLCVPVDSDTFRVSEAFRPYSAWKSFQNLVTQVRHASSEYTSLLYNNVIVYEFFMPLTNEGHLRTALDALFYKNTILSRLKTLDRVRLEKRFPTTEGEQETDYFKRISSWVSGRFGGYSISHVNGRFLASSMCTMQEAAMLQEDGGRYLVDETTAIVRFIFYCGAPIVRRPPLSSRHFEDEEEAEDSKEPDDAKLVRWFFGALFVQSITQVVNGEDEIWMVESGMRHRLHIWRIEK